ncbi:hypothetical protein MNBD_ALPHA09-2229 [hydrothermal vent metagenome]|uniref:Methyltransferase domain-containing protein n=1 Tax=hydrothermal vent metagenome TaxID=652676 RepID=A0A3B0TZW5_9ZZZZ
MAIDVEDEEGDDYEDDDNPWSSSRLAVIQMVWGEGFTEPGGAKFTKNLLGWLALNSRQTVLDLSAGLGGTARAVASAQSLWMDAVEPVPELATEGRRQSIVAGLERQVPVTLADLETHEFAKGRYDAIYSRERLFTVRNKARLLATCTEALKVKGQILITDYLRASDIGGAELTANWGQQEKILPNAWTMKAYVECLTELDLNIITALDITEDIVDHINAAWRRVPKMIADGTFSHRQISYLIKEGEIWQDRLQAMESGQLIVGRIHAQKVKKQP